MARSHGEPVPRTGHGVVVSAVQCEQQWQVGRWVGQQHGPHAWEWCSKVAQHCSAQLLPYLHLPMPPMMTQPKPEAPAQPTYLGRQWRSERDRRGRRQGACCSSI